MHKIVVNNIINGGGFGSTFETLEELNEWRYSQIASNGWGLPARDMILDRVPKELDSLVTETYSIKRPDEQQPVYILDSQGSIYLDDDNKPVQQKDEDGNLLFDTITYEPVEWAKLKAEYTIEITDISFEHSLEVCYAKRVKEYGPMGEQMDMIYHGGLDVWKAHIDTVKANNPKPIQE